MTPPDILARIAAERIALPKRETGYRADALLILADALDDGARHATHTGAKHLGALADGLRNEARAARHDAGLLTRPAIPLREAPDALRREKGSRA
jgi:hypothetical protein